MGIRPPVVILYVVVDPVVSVKTLLLQAQMPDVTLRPGASVMARVASRGEQHGVIVLAGIPLTARLPDGVEAGATLKLHVDEVTPERVVLRLDTQAAAGLAAPPPAPRPQARVAVHEPPRRNPALGEDGVSVKLSFESAALGRLDLQIDLGSGALQVGVDAPPGRAYELADDGAERLRATLEGATGLRSAVRVTPRREPLDLYA
jgi:hypothetical protein